MNRPVAAPAELQRELGELLARLLREGGLSLGRVIDVGGRRYRIRGFDPVSVRPRSLYVEDVGTGAWLSFELDEAPR